MSRVLPLVVCWSIVPINMGVYAAFLKSASDAMKDYSLLAVFIVLAVVQIVAGLYAALTAPPGAKTTRIVFGVLGCLFGVVGLAAGAGLPMLINL